MSSSSFSSPPEDQSQETEAPHAPVTRERRLNPDLQQQLPKPCMQLDLSPLPPLFCYMYLAQQSTGAIEINVRYN